MDQTPLCADLSPSPSCSFDLPGEIQADAALGANPLFLAFASSGLSARREPENPKGYIRKCTVLYGMKEYDKAISAAEQASEKDVDKKNTVEIQREMRKVMQAKFSERANETDEQTLQRAMRDPEVQAILQDPVMQREFNSREASSRWTSAETRRTRDID